MVARLCGSQSTPPGRTHPQRLALAQVLAGTLVNLSLGAGLPWATSVTDGERPLHKAVQISMSTDCSISRLLFQVLHGCLVWNNIRKDEASSSYKKHIFKGANWHYPRHHWWALFILSKQEDFALGHHSQWLHKPHTATGQFPLAEEGCRCLSHALSY